MYQAGELVPRRRVSRVELFELEPSAITLDAHLIEDLDLDSIDAIDMIEAVGTRLGTAGRASASFHVWTVMNAVLWHASWIEGREDCF